MAITYPREFPDCVFTGDCPFRLVRNQARSLTGAVSPDAIELAPPFWVGEWSTDAKTRAQFAAWEAWLLSLRGGIRLFKGRPNRHKWPLAHPRGFAGMTYEGDPFSGIGNLKEIAAGRDVITIDELPDGLTLSAGDWLSIPVGSRQHIHRILEGGTSASNEVAVTVEPVIMPGVVADIAVRLEAPYCDMTLAEDLTTPRPTGGGSVSFKGQQALI